MKKKKGICKTYDVGGLVCYGTYEKSYIEKLINEEKELPKNTLSIVTPFGVYLPDFEYEKKYIEIKSIYTYEILIGMRKTYFRRKVNTEQLKKIKWVGKHIKPVKLIVLNNDKVRIYKQITFR